MRITNDIPVVKATLTLPERKANVQFQQSSEAVRLYPSLQKAISAYTIISEAHQLVTMAINISYELIQKAFAPQTDRNEIIAKIATINNYFTRLSPGTVAVPTVPQPHTMQETSELIHQLHTAVQNNDTESIKAIHNSLTSHAQILEKTQKQLYAAFDQNTSLRSADLDVIKRAIEQNNENVLYAHKPLQYEQIERLLA